MGKIVDEDQPLLTMKPRWQNWVLAVLGLSIGIFLVGCAVLLTVDSKQSPPFILLLVFGPLALFLFLWPFWAVTKVTCGDEGVEFSSCGITYSRIRWKDIVKVETQTLKFSWLGYIILFMGNGGGLIPDKREFDFTTVNIAHRGAFLGLESAVSIKNYRVDDLINFKKLLDQKAGHLKRFENDWK